jgi:hypothetical protein
MLSGFIDSENLLSTEDQRIMTEAVKITDIAESQSISIRLLGALAIRLHITNSVDLFTKLERLGNANKLFTDADFIAYSKQRVKLRRLFEDELQFKIAGYAMLASKNRIIYTHRDGLFKVDIFFDALDFSHPVRFGNEPKNGRLALDSPTIPLVDLLLEKLQIHEITEKDVKDLVALLHEHQIGSHQEREVIDAKYFASTLANDWGFWYDANINLDKVSNLAAGYEAKGLISMDILAGVQAKIGELKKYIEQEPKSRDWNSRSKTGTQKQWWKDVEEVTR